MKLPRRQFLHLAVGAAALPSISRVARAQDYPTRPVRIIVPFPAGQATDTIARLMGQSLSERLLRASLRAKPDYQEFIGAKKHLVLALLCHICPSQGSYELARG